MSNNRLNTLGESKTSTAVVTFPVSDNTSGGAERDTPSACSIITTSIDGQENCIRKIENKLKYLNNNILEQRYCKIFIFTVIASRTMQDRRILSSSP